MASKNPGPLLTSVSRGDLDLIPREFRAKLGISQTVQEQPTDVDADVPDGISLVASRVEQERTNERKKTNVSLVGALTETLVSAVKLQDGQVGISTRSLVAEGTALVVDAKTTEANQTNLGTGLLDQTIIEAPEVLSLPEFTTEIPDVIPERFRVAVPKTVESETVEGVAIEPILQTGDLARSEKQLDLFKKRVTVEGRAGIVVPVSLTGKETNDDKQVVSVTETYRDEGVDPVPTATKDVTVLPLGAGRVLETTKTVPTVFDATRFTKEIPDVVPPEFRVAIPTVITDHVIAGTAVLPILGSGELSRTEEQIKVGIKKTSVTNRGGVTTAQLVDKETNNFKQVVTVTKQYRPAGIDPIPSAVKSVEIKDLGDGNVVETVKEDAVLFAEPSYSIILPETVPPEFRALLATRRASSVAAGNTIVPPTLLPGEISKSVALIDAFRVRTEVETRDTIGASNLTDKYFGGVEAGGSLFSGIVSRLKTYSPTTIQSPDQSYAQFASKVFSLGSGDSVKETDSLVPYPTLQDVVTDENKLQVTRTKSIVAVGTLPVDDFSSVRAIDSQRSLRIIEVSTMDPLTTYQVYSGFVDINLPAVLQEVKIGTSAESGAGNYSESGGYTLGVGGNGGVSLHGNCSGMASVLPNVDFTIWEPWSQNVRCRHWLFPIRRDNTNLTGGFHIALWNAYFGPAGLIVELRQIANLLAWPLWCPQSVNIVTTGVKKRSEVVGNIHAVNSAAIDYLGELKHTGSQSSFGGGVSQEVDLIQQVTRISPTIHGTLPVLLKTGNFQSASYVTSGQISVGFGPVQSMVTGDTATAFWSPSTISATPGTATIPTTGVYLFKFFVEPLKYDLVMLHYVTVDFAGILAG